MNEQRSFRFFALAVVCFLFLTITGQGAQAQGNDTATDQDLPSDGQNATDAVVPVDSDTDSDLTIVERKPEKADFIVNDSNGKPCLLASINITIWFKYHIQEGLIRETYTVSQKDEKDESSYEGSCEDNMSSLSITWNNNTFTLNLTFALEDRAVEERTKEDGLEMDVLPEGVNSTSSWALHQVALTYDTTNQQFFPGASNPSTKTVDPATVDLFKTPLGLSYMCETSGAVKLQFKDVEMVFNYVRLQPFAPQSAYFANETVECSGDMSTVPMTDASTTVPLVVAACLAGAVIVIIIGYAVHRCLTRHRHGQYKPMD
ncbi:hypothetical protein V1264_018203 [Littorina saxatilis]|uniref:Lysosome-associated membrane glycoprotein 1 n=1 Tax=Littorina saxatilis TaxID=31220 RepID=A0AAN9BEI6_9CAEN